MTTRGWHQKQSWMSNFRAEKKKQKTHIYSLVNLYLASTPMTAELVNVYVLIR